ncbi:MAG: tetratricopeptide repeat protein [Phycisphaerales bacterium]
MLRTVLTLSLLAIGLCGCATSENSAGKAAAKHNTAELEVFSLLGEPLRRPVLPEDVRERHLRNLEEAEANFRRNPESEDAAIWVGRRLAYLGRHNEAVGVFSDALDSHPQSFRLLRHRGHRFITLRRFDEAIDDLERAERFMGSRPDETEPDGLPNAAGIPIGSTRTNILYHLGLAHYLRGDFDASRDVFTRCLDASRNDDNRVSASYWLALSQARSGRRAEVAGTLAPISRDMRIIENHAYHRLLLLFKGDLTENEIVPRDQGDGVQDATVAYGVAAWRLINGDRDDAVRRFRVIVDSGSWAAFGHIAAEAELARDR